MKYAKDIYSKSTWRVVVLLFRFSSLHSPLFSLFLSLCLFDSLFSLSRPALLKGHYLLSNNIIIIIIVWYISFIHLLLEGRKYKEKKAGKKRHVCHVQLFSFLKQRKNRINSILYINLYVSFFRSNSTKHILWHSMMAKENGILERRRDKVSSSNEWMQSKKNE